MEKYLVPKAKQQTTNLSTLDLLGDTPLLPPPSPFRLGVLGSSSSNIWSIDMIVKTLLTPMFTELNQLPDAIFLPSEGNTSLLLQAWAEKQRYIVNVYEADWKKLGKRARALRDARIVKESTHLLIYLGKKSDIYEKIAIRELKKGKVIFCVDPNDNSLSHWLAEEE